MRICGGQRSEIESRLKVDWRTKAAASGDGGTSPTADAGRARDLLFKTETQARIGRDTEREVERHRMVGGKMTFQGRATVRYETRRDGAAICLRCKGGPGLNPSGCDRTWHTRIHMPILRAQLANARLHS